MTFCVIMDLLRLSMQHVTSAISHWRSWATCSATALPETLVVKSASRERTSAALAMSGQASLSRLNASVFRCRQPFAAQWRHIKVIVAHFDEFELYWMLDIRRTDIIRQDMLQ